MSLQVYPRAVRDRASRTVSMFQESSHESHPCQSPTRSRAHSRLLFPYSSLATPMLHDLFFIKDFLLACLRRDRTGFLAVFIKVIKTKRWRKGATETRIEGNETRRAANVRASWVLWHRSWSGGIATKNRLGSWRLSAARNPCACPPSPADVRSRCAASYPRAPGAVARAVPSSRGDGRTAPPRTA